MRIDTYASKRFSQTQGMNCRSSSRGVISESRGRSRPGRGRLASPGRDPSAASLTSCSRPGIAGPPEARGCPAQRAANSMINVNSGHTQLMQRHIDHGATARAAGNRRKRARDVRAGTRAPVKPGMSGRGRRPRTARRGVRAGAGHGGRTTAGQASRASSRPPPRRISRSASLAALTRTSGLRVIASRRADAAPAARRPSSPGRPARRPGCRPAASAPRRRRSRAGR